MNRILFILLLLPVLGRGQIITTIAGNGVAGYTGNGGAATAAEFNYPHGIALDSNNNIYVADMQNNVIRKINTAGIVSRIAGNGVDGYTGDGGSATLASINFPGGIAMAKNGDYYILDRFNNRIRKVNTAGIITNFAGNGLMGYTGDGGIATDASFHNPYDIAVDDLGSVYVADYDNNAIRKIEAATGIITTVAGNGLGSFSGDGGPATAASMYAPLGVAADHSGNIYISDSYNSRIRKVDADGIISTIAGTGVFGFSGDHGAASLAEISTPASIKVDNTGNVYFYDVQNNRIRKIATSGFITTVAGNGTAGYSGDGAAATDAEINLFGIAIDHCDNLYISDRTNNRIREVSGINGDANICVGTYSIFTDEGPGGTWYTSAPGIAALTLGSGCLVTGISAGTANIYYVIGTDTAVSQVTVDTLNAGTIIGAGIVCVGAADTLSNNVGFGMWSCTNPNASISLGVLTGGVAGADTIVYTVNNSCGIVNTQFVVTINPLPNAGVVSGANTLCVGDTITLADTVNGGVWGITDTVKAHLYGAGLILGLSPGNTNVYYAVASLGCRDSSFFPINIQTEAACEAGITPIALPMITALYPNPATYEIIITSPDRITHISITNSLGQVVYSNEYVTATGHVDIANLANGIYFVKVNNTKVLKFVKE